MNKSIISILLRYTRPACNNIQRNDIFKVPWITCQVAGVKNWKVPEKVQDVEFPPERQKLRFIERTPLPSHPSGKHLKVPKRLLDMRGPEPHHTFLLHKQYGIRAKSGGQMHWGHMDMIRLTVNRKMDETRMFAIWRVDSPWKPITKKGQGHRMGGGKGAIDKFVTPVKAGRIIVEMGGFCKYEEVFPILDMVARKLPFKAEVVHQQMLEDEKAEEDRIKNENINPFNWEYSLKNNMLGCKTWCSPYDYLWYGKFR